MVYAIGVLLLCSIISNLIDLNYNLWNIYIVIELLKVLRFDYLYLMKLKNIIFIISSIILIISCGEEPDDLVVKKSNTSKIKTTPIINYIYVNSFPHDINSFTEGFLIHNGELYESTGATDGLPQSKSLFGMISSKRSFGA